jgi:drug efflux transport system permease protein
VSGWLITLAAVVRKELLQATRDPRMVFMLLVAPLVQIIVFGYAANLAFEHADTVVVDQDKSAESRDFREGLAADRTFHVTEVASVEKAEAEVTAGRAQIAIVIPHGYGRRLLAGQPDQVQALMDGSDPSRGVQAGYAVEAYAATRALPVAPPAGVPALVLAPRLLYNPGLKGRIFMVPGTAASILIIVTTIVTAMGLTREREMGTLEQLLVTPIHPLVLMVGKIIPYAIFGLIDATFILVVGNVLFDVPIRGSLWLAFGGVALYLVATLGVGLVISTLARTQQQALMAGFFFIMPAILLSGFMTPVAAMPAWIRPITYVNPMRWFLEIWRTVLLRGGHIGDVVPQTLALTGLSVLVMIVATVRFRRSIG